MANQSNIGRSGKVYGQNRVLIRLDTLIRLRWYAIAGQLLAVMAIAFGFSFPMLWLPCLILIACSTSLNIALVWWFKSNHHVSGHGVFVLLIFDILQLATLLFLTGGLQNPFAILLLAPVVVSATSLKLNHTLILGTLTIIIVSLLAFYHLPLPWFPGETIDMHFVYSAGTWFAIVCTLAFTAIYAFRVAEESRRLGDALSATELVLQHEQHLSLLDGLAAAAAHELGTPLATIALVSKEITNDIPEGSALHEDAALLRSQAGRCRDILQKLTSLSSANEDIMQRQSLSAVVEEEVAPLRDFGTEIEIQYKGDGSAVPESKRNPGMHYAIGNLLDNAVSFAKEKVVIVIDWNAETAMIEITDDGPGFSSSILNRIGEPYISTQKNSNEAHRRGLGLGLFIAKTLLERSGAELTFGNSTDKSGQRSGACITIVWARERLEEKQKSPQLAASETALET